MIETVSSSKLIHDHDRIKQTHPRPWPYSSKLIHDHDRIQANSSTTMTVFKQIHPRLWPYQANSSTTMTVSSKLTHDHDRIKQTHPRPWPYQANSSTTMTVSSKLTHEHDRLVSRITVSMSYKTYPKYWYVLIRTVSSELHMYNFFSVRKIWGWPLFSKLESLWIAVERGWKVMKSAIPYSSVSSLKSSITRAWRSIEIDEAEFWKQSERIIATNDW